MFNITRLLSKNLTLFYSTLENKAFNLMLDILLALYLLFSVGTGLYFCATVRNLPPIVRGIAVLISPVYTWAIWILAAFFVILLRLFCAYRPNGQKGKV